MKEPQQQGKILRLLGTCRRSRMHHRAMRLAGFGVATPTTRGTDYLKTMHDVL